MFLYVLSKFAYLSANAAFPWLINPSKTNLKCTAINAIDGNINLQKLVNRTLDLYVKDESFRNKINNYTDLAVSGSKY